MSWRGSPKKWIGCYSHCWPGSYLLHHIRPRRISNDQWQDTVFEWGTVQCMEFLPVYKCLFTQHIGCSSWSTIPRNVTLDTNDQQFFFMRMYVTCKGYKGCERILLLAAQPLSHINNDRKEKKNQQRWTTRVESFLDISFYLEALSSSDCLKFELRKEQAKKDLPPSPAVGTMRVSSLSIWIGFFKTSSEY